MRDDYWTLSFPRLTQDASGDFYPDSPKDTTMTTDQPAWATDPRGLPPTVHGECRQWMLNEDGTYGIARHTPAQLEALIGDLTPIWPDTQPTSPDAKDDTMTIDQPTSPLPDLSRWHPVPVGATIPAGTEYAYRLDRSIYFVDSGRDGVTQYSGDYARYTEHPILDPDADLIKRLQEALANQDVPYTLSEDQVRIMLGAIRKEQS